MTYRFKKFEGKKLAFLYMIYVGVIMLIFSPIFVFSISKSDANIGATFGIILTIAMPLFYGVFTYLFSRVLFWFFNILLDKFNGFEIELEAINLKSTDKDIKGEDIFSST
ncbi:MAG: hypothetical protein MI717_01610 [Spirochaetales bacterium]|nr:hypothetical protein [Spirochaetales bacterium]